MPQHMTSVFYMMFLKELVHIMDYRYFFVQLEFIYIKFQQKNKMIKGTASTIPKQWSSKTVQLKNNPNLKEQIKDYFLKTYDVYEKLFELLGDERAYYIRAQPLRHPLIFYYGHTASVYVNKFIDHGLITSRINERLEKVFAVGVDQMDWDDLNQSHYQWPKISQAREFRKKVKDMILNVIDRSQQKCIDSWLSGLYVIMLGIEHERIHLETSAVIMRMVPLEYIKKVEDFIECQYKQNVPQNVPHNQFVSVSPWKSTWDRSLQNLNTYGWDSQFGIKQFDVAGFQASKMLVSNAEYLQFVKQGGYNNLDWWSQEGKRWINSKKRAMPVFWVKIGNQYKLRTISSLIDMPWDWPAEVNNLQARAFCKWKSAKTNTYIRLPTEDEYYSIRRSLSSDQTEWEYQSVGNINMQYWMSPNPVNMFKSGDFYDVVGNVWQHTITPVYPFKKFEIHPVYEDFSTPTFDERHDMIKGGSFISTGNEALYHARYAFRRHFYQFAGFRYIATPIELEVDLHTDEIISDFNVEMNLKHHYLNDQSYVLEFSQQIKKAARNSAKNSKILTVGCSVGRAPIEFSKDFKESIGIDYTTRYFQMSTRLKQKQFLRHKDIDINLQTLNLNPESTELYQMNPENPDEKKINNCDWIVIDGFSLRSNCLGNVLKKIPLLAKSWFNIAVLNVSGVNDLSKEQERKILAANVNGQVIVGQQKILNASFNDQSYLPNCQQKLQFRLNFYSIIEP